MPATKSPIASSLLYLFRNDLLELFNADEVVFYKIDSIFGMLGVLISHIPNIKLSRINFAALDFLD